MRTHLPAQLRSRLHATGSRQGIEAETYAHQAFREHGMTMPRKLSNWGRQYVASWIAKDRAANIPIDPRVIAYATVAS